MTPTPRSFGDVAINAVTEETFNIVNGGVIDATNVSGGGLISPFRFKGGGFPGAGGDCLPTIPGGGNCNIVVEFAPLQTGSYNDTIEIYYFNGVGTTQLDNTITGEGKTPALITINQTDPFNFGTLVNSNTGTQTFTLTNMGCLLYTSDAADE